MHLRSKLKRLPVVATMTCMLAFFAVASRAQDANSILQKARDTYVGLKSYADKGTILNEYGADATDKHTFSTYFNRAPRHFLLEFNKQGGDEFVIWGEPDAFHTWWKTTGTQTDYPNPNNAPAFSLSTEPTKGASTKIPTLLYGKSQLAAAMLELHDPELDGTEDIGGHHCHRIRGRMSDVYAATQREVNIRKVTVWIDTDSLLVRKMIEESKALPGQRSRTITSYEPQANPSLQETSFKFVPPQAN
jgi:Predicted periplasmic protein (DUF2092)